MISLIVACDSRNAIGKNNEIPWYLSDDLKRFKSITMGNTVIMGKNTWLSLPFKPLKGRKNIVISSIMPETDGCIVCRTIEEALDTTKNDAKVFIIGGSAIYNQMIKYADELIVTHINKEFDGTDAFFPTIDKEEWEISEQSDTLYDEKNNLEYIYITYSRKNKQ